MSARAFVLVALIGLTGCAGGPLQIPKEVSIQVPVPCIAQKDRPERPTLRSDAELLALDSYRFTWALWGDRLESAGYIGKLEAIVEGCSRLAPAAAP